MNNSLRIFNGYRPEEHEDNGDNGDNEDKENKKED